MQLPRGGNADTEVRCEITLIFGSGDSQVGVQMGSDVLYVRSNVSMVLGDDEIFPLGDNMRRELGDRCGGDRLKDVMNVSDIRLDLLHVWLDYRVRERVVDEGVRIWFQNMITRCGNGAADRVGALVDVLTDKKPIRSEPPKGYFEDKVDETPEDTLLALLLHDYGSVIHDGRNARSVRLQETISAAI